MRYRPCGCYWYNESHPGTDCQEDLAIREKAQAPGPKGGSMYNSRYQASQGYGQEGQKDKCVQDGQIYQDLCAPDQIPDTLTSQFY